MVRSRFDPLSLARVKPVHHSLRHLRVLCVSAVDLNVGTDQPQRRRQRRGSAEIRLGLYDRSLEVPLGVKVSSRVVRPFPIAAPRSERRPIFYLCLSGV